MSTMTSRFTSADNLHELVETGFKLQQRLLQFVLLMLVISLAIALYVKPNYVASSEMVVLPSNEYTFRPTAGSHSLANEALSLENMMDSEIAIIRSPALAHAVIAQIGVKTLYPAMVRRPNLLLRLLHDVHDMFVSHKATRPGDIVERAIPLFESHLDAVAGADNDVITISFGNPKPAVARQVVATLQKLYLARRRRIFTDRQSRAVARAVAAQRVALNAAEARLTAFQTAHNVTQFQTRESILLNQQGQMEQDLMATNSNVAQLTTSLAALHQAHGTVPRAIALQQSTNIDERTMALRTSLDALRSRLASLLSNYRADSPEAENLRAQIATESALLAHATANDAPSSLQSGQNPVYAQINLELMQDSAALAAARTRAAQDRSSLVHLAAQLAKLDALKAQLGTLERQRSLAAANYADATRTLSERQLVEQVDAEKRANVRVLSPPSLPLNPSPLRKLIMLAGGVLTLFGIVMIVLLGNFFRKGALLGRVLEADTGIPLLGIIPELGFAQMRQVTISQ
ncbi:hypothetical protein AruPA_16435 [Acidiphilium sp. PA]|uniref:hypothetical protein n=1 Tax=Acidiphilium sp. PA TaxID=2871705 RepID=UPI0022449D2F|nr:hypothetical protein [Acidiphilium sp. PA]MCW8308625.1 hypothetical protein [Acidiphilium sp. PA]